LLLCDGAFLLTAAQTTPTVYEWEDRDFYSILGLDNHSIKEYDAKDIQKAYRKQARMWHPDKLLNRQQNTTTTDESNSSVTMQQREESNARFSRIAEAYQVLSDEDQRQSYDMHLRRKVQYQQQQSSRQQQYASSSDDTTRWDQQPRDERMDPFRMFQEFFFGDDNEEEDDPYFHQNFAHVSFDELRFIAENNPPDRVQQEQYTDGRNNERLRILETASYYFPTGVYMRAVAQDLGKDRQGIYRLREARIVKEGFFEYRPDTSLPNSIDDMPSTDPSTLWPGVSLVAGSTMRTGNYVATLNWSCELSVIYYENESEDDHPVEELIWFLDEVEDFVRPPHHGDVSDCRLQLHGSQLVLMAGTNPRVTLWRSTRTTSTDGSSGVESYVSRLDADGSLAVYRIETVSFLTPWLSRLWKATMLETASFSSSTHWKQRLVSVVPERLWTVIWSVVAGGRLWRLSPTHVVRSVCQSAIGSPVGCFRLGRLLVQLYREGKHLVGRILSFLDRLLE
jgi:curved DNA-binding protein CbpA